MNLEGNSSINYQMLLDVADALSGSNKKIVFAGAAILFLYLNKDHKYVRKSKDIDILIDYNQKTELYEFEDSMWDLGFINISSGVLSRWTLKNIIVEIIPSAKVIGFENEWMREGYCHAKEINICNITIKIPTPTYFLGMKIEAFNKRGSGDYSNSKDIYDMLILLIGRSTVVEEIHNESNNELRKRIQENIGFLYDNKNELGLLVERYSPIAIVNQNFLEEIYSRICKVVINN